jgi:diaminohydroxyphosphoribosylaminopyrimidine deaminase / 5-amino-6-(5-phosphoribosylamino)uracil reductase
MASNAVGEPHPGDAAPPVTPAERTALLRAFELAALGPVAGPNPQVGAVLLAADGTTVAEGFHRGAGTPHAEVDAIARARADGADLRGATAVVTLEPCRHTGRTGPCTTALLDAGIARVVAAVPDPGRTSGGGAEVLRAAGVDVALGVLRTEGEKLLRVWLHAMRTGRPFVTLKIATTFDGRVSAADGTSQWITSPEARAHAHRTRGQVDAIAVGTGTALSDDPALTARTADGALDEHQPLRVVVGRRDLPPTARLHGPGGELLQLPTHDPAQVLAALADREVRHLLVEGGPTLTTAFLRAGLVDEVHTYLAPVLLGSGRSAVGDLGIGTIADALRLVTAEVRQLGPDVLVVAHPQEA